MNSFPKNDCLLKRVEELELEAKGFGFYWETIHQLLGQVQSECEEIEEAWNHQDTSHLQEEIGDLIHAAVGLAVFCNFDPHETLSKSIKKFTQRYDALVEMAKEDGYNGLHNQSYELLMHYWNRAKNKPTNKI